MVTSVSKKLVNNDHNARLQNGRPQTIGEVMVELHLAATIGQFILIRKKTLKTGCK